MGSWVPHKVAGKNIQTFLLVYTPTVLGRFPSSTGKNAALCRHAYLFMLSGIIAHTTRTHTARLFRRTLKGAHTPSRSPKHFSNVDADRRKAATGNAGTKLVLRQRQRLAKLCARRGECASHHKTDYHFITSSVRTLREHCCVLSSLS